MAQGKAWDKELILKSLEPYLSLGYSRYKSCVLAGFDEALLSRWEQKHPELTVRINSMINQPNAMARRNWVSAISNGDLDASQEWLKRRERDDFSEKQVVDQNHSGAVALTSEEQAKRLREALGLKEDMGDYIRGDAEKSKP